MATRKKNVEDFIHRIKKSSKNGTGPPCRFEDYEIESLLEMFKQYCGNTQRGKMDRSRFRDELQTKFGITDDFLMDRIFRAFDKDNDGFLKQEEWIYGLHVFLKGDLDDHLKFCFLVYDMNGDGYISRDEMFHLLKNSIVKSGSEEDVEEFIKELVDTALKKLDMDHDGRVSFQDFKKAVNTDDLLLECLGPCLPSKKVSMQYLALIQSNLGIGGGMKMTLRKQEEHEAQKRAIQQRKM